MVTFSGVIRPISSRHRRLLLPESPLLVVTARFSLTRWHRTPTETYYFAPTYISRGSLSAYHLRIDRHDRRSFSIRDTDIAPAHRDLPCFFFVFLSNYHSCKKNFYYRANLLFICSVLWLFVLNKFGILLRRAASDARREKLRYRANWIVDFEPSCGGVDRRWRINYWRVAWVWAESARFHPKPVHETHDEFH